METLLSDIPALIRSFLVGEMDIVTFRELYDTHPEINDFLQGVIEGYLREEKEFLPVPHPDRRKGGFIYYKDVCYFRNPEEYPGWGYGNRPYGCVRDYLTQEFRLLTTNVRTASGAWKFYYRLYDLFYQFDQTVPYQDQQYETAFDFMLDTIPEYLQGGYAEMYIQEKIFPQFPESMGKTARKKAIKAKIREEFRSEKGYPAWIQSSQWPLGADGKPCTYLGKKKKFKGELIQYVFRDESNGETVIVEQFH